MSVLKLENVCFSYGKRKILNDISYDFEAGKMYAVVGKSGAGKTTLLSLLSGLAKVQKGAIYYNGKNINEIDKYYYRSRFVGVIFQSFNLITKYTALDNIMLSMDISGAKIKQKRKEAIELLAKMGLDSDEAERHVLKLSGGQQQRVAIARALSYNPDIILADEPTGNLDMETQNEILEIFKNLAKEGKCVIIVTHSKEVANSCDAVYELSRL